MAPPRKEPEKKRKLFVGGIDYNVTQEQLKAYYEQFGEVVDCVLMKNRATNASKGFGFVTFRTSDMVDNAQSHRPHRLNGKEVQPKRAVPRELSHTIAARLSVKKIFVGGLKEAVDVADLQAYFSRYGNIISTDILRERYTGRKRGFAFVEFDDYDPVDKVILHRRHIINGKKADVKKAMARMDMEFMKKRKELAAAQTYSYRHGISPGEALIHIRRNRGYALRIFSRRV